MLLVRKKKDCSLAVLRSGSSLEHCVVRNSLKNTFVYKYREIREARYRAFLFDIMNKRHSILIIIRQIRQSSIRYQFSLFRISVKPNLV